MALNVSIVFPRTQVAGFIVEEVSFQDEIGACFELTLHVESLDPAIDMQLVVGEHVDVTLGDEPLMPRVSGIVRHARQLTAEPTGMSRYALIVVPRLWLATRRTDHRIFQNQSADQIVSSVVSGYAGRIPAPALRFVGTPPVHEYVVQYGETDFDFLRRILADEGLVSFFDHASGSAWTIVDDTSVAALVAPAVPFIPPTNLTPSQAQTPRVEGVEIISRVETSAIAVRDYDFERPLLPLSGRVSTPPSSVFTNEGNLEAYEYAVGAFASPADGIARADQLLAEARREQRALRCEASFALACGTMWGLTGHPRADVNGNLLVLRSTMTWRSTSPNVSVGRHMLECVASASPYRPPRLPRPRIAGTQTAVVVGAPGEEIDVDSYGRVELELRWDRRDLHAGGVSRRVRVAQAWAGAGYGLVTLPRVGDEVIVAYLDGDPDEPIIVGRVHNAVVPTPLALPANKTQSVWRSRSSPGGNGYNEILFEDAAGAERIEIHAHRDLIATAGRNASLDVTSDAKTKIGGSSATTVSGGASLAAGSVATSTGPYTVDAETVKITASGSMLLKSGPRKDKSSSHVIDTGDATVIADTILLQAGTIRLVAGGSSIVLTNGAIAITSGGPVTINGAVVKLNC